MEAEKKWERVCFGNKTHGNEAVHDETSNFFKSCS